MAMYTAYLDTSGDYGRRAYGQAFATVGMVASVRQWQGFERDWNALLAREGIPYVQMRDRVKIFKRDDEREHRVLSSAFDLIRKRTIKCFIVTMLPEEYGRVTKEFRVDDDAFAFNLASALFIVEGWCRAKLPNIDALRHFHEAGDGGLDPGFALAKKWGVIAAPLPAEEDAGGKKYLAPFQATDALGWEVRRFLETFIAESLAKKAVPTPPRPLVEGIARDLKAEFHMNNYENVRDLCIEKGFSRR